MSWIDQFKGEALGIFENFRNPVFCTFLLMGILYFYCLRLPHNETMI